MVLLSAHQPCYLPWMGLLNKIYNSDIFVILDNVKYEKGSYINRVQIKTAQGPHWLTIPVPRDSYKQKIKDVKCANYETYGNHVKTVHHNYQRAKYYWEHVINYLSISGLSELPVAINNFAIIRFLMKDILRMYDDVDKIQRQPDCDGEKQDLIINLCKHYNADAFLFGAKGRDYVDVEYFKDNGIEPLFQDFKCIEYPQQWGGGFVPGLSVIDALFNVGAEKTLDLIKGGYELPKKL